MWDILGRAGEADSLNEARAELDAIEYLMMHGVPSWEEIDDGARESQERIAQQRWRRKSRKKMA